MKITGIISKEYRDDIARLAADPIVKAMFDELPAEMRASITAGEQQPVGFMTASCDEYRKRGGGDTTHMGAIATAMTFIGEEGS